MIPVTVITGFLGSGKTTLLAHLLRHPTMARTAVIINEFGEIPLDHNLIETSDESFVRLSNGCLCCTVRSDLTLTLGDLARRRIDGSVPAFERVMIETSGLADPAPILQTLMADGELNGIYTLGNVVTVVDALLGLATLDEHETSRHQVAVADCIVLSKTELADAQVDTVTQRIARMNPRARITRAVCGAIEPDQLFNRDSYAHHADIGECFEHENHAHTHDQDISSLCIVRDAPLHAVTLPLLLSALAENCGPDLLRMKGIINVLENPQRPAVIQGVQHVYHAPVWLAHWPSDDRRTRLVFIGRKLNESWVRKLIDLLEQEVEAELQRHATLTIVENIS